MVAIIGGELPRGLTKEQRTMLREREVQKRFGLSIRESEIYISLQEGWHVNELAEAMGMTTGALCSIQARAKAKVKKAERKNQREIRKEE